MKCWELHGKFGFDGLGLTEASRPRLGYGQVLMRMKAVSLNFRDILMVQGLYNPRQPLPLIPCSDGVGEVVELGEGVSNLKPGARVMPIFAQAWLSGQPTKENLKTTLGGPLQGTLTEYMVVDAQSVVRCPEYLTDVEAASLPCATLTAWHALVEQGNVKAGDSVLILGTGGVAISALQLAKLLGARVIITSSSDEKLARARQLGADDVINYRENPKWAPIVRDLTDGRGVDHVIEVGGAGTFEQSMRSVRVGGTISLIGVLAGGAQQLNIVPILMQNIRVQGIIVGNKAMFESMNRALELHQMRPVIDRVFGFDEAVEAFQHLSDASHFGKVCIKI